MGNSCFSFDCYLYRHWIFHRTKWVGHLTTTNGRLWWRFDERIVGNHFSYGKHQFFVFWPFFYLFDRNFTTTATTIEETFWLFRISFMYYSFIGLMVVIIVGYPVSLMTSDDSILDERLLTPFMRSKEYKEKERLSRRFEAEYSQMSQIEQKQFEMKNIIK